jgi:hypothetical protein
MGKHFRLLQIFSKTGNESWPALMVPLSLFVNNGFMIVGSPTNLLCYYKINEELAWHVSYLPLNNDGEIPNCTAWISLKNNYFTQEYNITLRFIQPSL